MPLAQTVLRVFVSSPRDVAAERCAVVEAMQELNRTWSAHLGLRLEPILWEADCRPSVSTDPQQAINEQIPPDYDVFLGILWKRFGTKKPRFGRGTEEEFETAYLRQR